MRAKEILEILETAIAQSIVEKRMNLQYEEAEEYEKFLLVLKILKSAKNKKEARLLLKGV